MVVLCSCLNFWRQRKTGTTWFEPVGSDSKEFLYFSTRTYVLSSRPTGRVVYTWTGPRVVTSPNPFLLSWSQPFLAVWQLTAPRSRLNNHSRFQCLTVSSSWQRIWWCLRTLTLSSWQLKLRKRACTSCRTATDLAHLANGNTEFVKGSDVIVCSVFSY